MSRSQTSKAKMGLAKLEFIMAKTERRIDNLKRNLVEQKQFYENYIAKLKETEVVRNALCRTKRSD